MTLERIETAGTGMSDAGFGTAETVYGDFLESMAGAADIRDGRLGSVRYAAAILDPVANCRIGDRLTDDNGETWTVASTVFHPFWNSEHLALEKQDPRPLPEPEPEPIP